MNEPARFGSLAWLYRWMEYFSFGPYLAQCRKLRLEEATRHYRALIYGDGDGRFLAELVRHAPELQVVAIDASAEMLHETARRLPDADRLRLIHSDALICEPKNFPEAPFDLVVSHFFLDCFREPEIAQLLPRVRNAVSGSAVWIVSEFAIPPQSPAKQLATLIVRSLYFAFGLLTGLKTNRLPDHGRFMLEAGWMLEDRRELLFGLLISERWRLSSPQNTVHR